jgi:hypothetical protein
MARPLADDGKLRALVRDALTISPGTGVEDVDLCDTVRDLMPLHTATDSDILRAAEWNLSKDFVRTEINDDTDNREWFITKDGLAKQSIK